MAAGKAIAKVQTTDRLINQLQDNITQSVGPVVANPLSLGNLLASQSLTAGSNTVNTGLQAPLQGWFIVRQRSAASIYDTQDSNPSPDKFLVLQSSADVVVDIYVF